MTRALAVVAALAVSCSPEIRDDWFTCDLAAAEGCPSGLSCVAGRCVREGGGAHDAGGMDASGSDAGPDASGGCPADCDDDGNPCTLGCNPSTCAPLPRADGDDCGGGVCCSGVCLFDTDDNPLACGAGCMACRTDETCVGGACECEAGLTSCDDACVNLDTDPANCGTCGNECATGLSCNLRECGTCTGDGQCDDGYACTADRCVGGTCQSTVTTGCLIGTSCVPEGQPRPSNSCLACISATSDSSWSPRTGAVCDDGSLCTGMDVCNAMGACVPGASVGCPGACRGCDPSTGGCAPLDAVPCTSPVVPCAAAVCRLGTCEPDSTCGASLSLTMTPGANCSGTSCVPCGATGQPCCIVYSLGTGRDRLPCASFAGCMAGTCP